MAVIPVTEVAADILEQARARDTARSALLNQAYSSRLLSVRYSRYCLKTIINTADIPQAPGPKPFSLSLPGRTPPLVRTLREQGAVILGKTIFQNLPLTFPPSCPRASRKAGQTVNPFGPLKISPSRLLVAAAPYLLLPILPSVPLFRDRNGRIHFRPAAANSVVGFKPLPGQHIRRRNQRVDSGGLTPPALSPNVSDASCLRRPFRFPADLSGQEDALNGTVIGLLYLPGITIREDT